MISPDSDDSLVGLSGGPSGIEEELWQGKEKGSNQRHRDLISELTAKATASYDFKTFNDTKEIYWYDKKLGVYRSNGESIIEALVESTKPNISTHEVNEIINHVKRRTLTPKSEFDSQIEWLTIGNCVVNLKTLEIKTHSAEFMAITRIPWNYIPASDVGSFFEMVGDYACQCPKITKFMNQIMSRNDIETILDFLSYCLWRDYPFHNYLIFHGPGRNGKGVMARIIHTLFGIQNTASESLQSILNSRFSTSRLANKLVNIDADMSQGILKNTGILKKLTGGDLIMGEEKFKSAFDFVNHAKLILIANELPQTEDETDAFFARPIIINFQNQFYGDNIDPYLAEKLCTEEELSGLLSLLIRRLPRVLRTGIMTATNNSMEQNYFKYIKSSNSVKAFVEECLDRGDDDDKISKHDLYRVFRTYYKEGGFPYESEQSFSRKMKKEFGFQYKQLANGKATKAYYWIGIKIKDEKVLDEVHNNMDRFILTS